jgi:hypothetical protein
MTSTTVSGARYSVRAPLPAPQTLAGTRRAASWLFSGTASYGELHRLFVPMCVQPSGSASRRSWRFCWPCRSEMSAASRVSTRLVSPLCGRPPNSDLAFVGFIGCTLGRLFGCTRFPWHAHRCDILPFSCSIGRFQLFLFCDSSRGAL